MSQFFEIAYAAASNRLCLFTGTGFSKAVTNNEALGWQELLESICDILPNNETLKNALFPENENNPLGLDEAAQVISLEFTKNNKNIHQEIATKIKSFTLQGDNSIIINFLSKISFKAITTNYDKLLEDLTANVNCQSLTPGLQIPRLQSKAKIYHIHGSIDSPKNMIVTSDDYFKFINNESYFSRKLSTILHENTVVILGYSLGDTNLKAIINDHKSFSRNHSLGSSIFFVSRSRVNQPIKDYYSHCYGIRVLDQLEVHDFFNSLNKSMPEAEKRLNGSIENIRKVIYNKHHFTEDYLGIEITFFEIISSLTAIGASIKDDRVVETLGEIIEVKIKLTQKTGAWEQYEHLAKWLIYLARIFELKDTSIEKIYLTAALRSMTTSKKELYLGYSWKAYKEWNNSWSEITASNRLLIKKHIEENTYHLDALDLVKNI